MTYATELAAITRTPIQLVRITADHCDRVFGTTPCDATGTECYNTFETCVFTSAWLNTTGKLYKFTTRGTPAPWNEGERPYLEKVKLIPQEVKEVRTVVARATITIADEPDTDVGIDPYVSTRSSVQGTYWKKWLTRNKHYKGRLLEVLDGFDSITEANFVSKFRGTIESIKVGNGRVVIQAVDYVHDLTQVYWPPKVNVRVTYAVTAASTEIPVDNVGELQSPSGFILINDEVIGYTTVNTTTRWVTGLTRGDKGTTAAAHDVDDKVTRMGYVAEDDISDNIASILVELGMDLTEWDLISLASLWSKPQLSLPKSEFLVAKPTKMSELLGEMMELGEVIYWIGEDTKITFARRVPNYGARTFGTITDEANIVKGSVRIDLADEKRITRFNFRWGFNLFGSIDEPGDYKRRDLVIDVAAESADEYNEEVEYEVNSQLMREAVSYTTAEDHHNRLVNFLKRYVWFNREPREIVQLRVELKDSGIKTGSFQRLSTNELQDRNGNAWSDIECQVIKRELQRNHIQLTLRRQPRRKIAFIAPDASPDFSAADADDKQYAFIANDSPNEGRMNNENDDGYYIV